MKEFCNSIGWKKRENQYTKNDCITFALSQMTFFSEKKSKLLKILSFKELYNLTGREGRVDQDDTGHKSLNHFVVSSVSNSEQKN